MAAPDTARMVSHISLSFHSSTRSASRLAELVDAERAPLDPDVLAVRANFEAPSDAEETPYVGIRCRLHEPAPIDVDWDEARTATSAVKAAELLRRVLGQVVEKTIGDARRVAVMTSGGLDSSGVLVLAHEWARRTGGSVFAVSLESEAPGDDRPHLRALEAKLGCEVVRLEAEDAAARVMSLIHGVDGAPFNCPSAPAEVELMARARAHGADVVLTGAGGDDLFDGH